MGSGNCKQAVKLGRVLRAANVPSRNAKQVVRGIAYSVFRARALTETGATLPPVYGGEIQRSMKAVCHAANRALRHRDEQAFDALALVLEDVLNDDNSAALLLAAALPGLRLETFTDFRFTGNCKPVLPGPDQLSHLIEVATAVGERALLQFPRRNPKRSYVAGHFAVRPFLAELAAHVRLAGGALTLKRVDGDEIDDPQGGRSLTYEGTAVELIEALRECLPEEWQLGEKGRGYGKTFKDIVVRARAEVDELRS